MNIVQMLGLDSRGIPAYIVPENGPPADIFIMEMPDNYPITDEL